MRLHHTIICLKLSRTAKLEAFQESILFSPDDPSIDDEAFRQLALFVEDHLALGAAPHPVAPARHEPVARAVGDTLRQHWGGREGKDKLESPHVGTDDICVSPKYSNCSIKVPMILMILYLNID